MFKKINMLGITLMSSASFAAPIPDSALLNINVELPKISAPMYARPYVAIWVEDANRQVVKTIQLWVGQDEWLKDLRSWWRKSGRYDQEMVDAITSATRPSGQYRFTWDGKDTQGKRVERGEYTFFAEVVREHGGRSLIRQTIVLGDNPMNHTIKPTDETGEIHLSYQIK